MKITDLLGYMERQGGDLSKIRTTYENVAQGTGRNGTAGTSWLKENWQLDC